MIAWYRYFLLMGFILIQNIVIQAQTATTEEEKIQQLIRAVEVLKDAQFWRNGTWYTSQKAGEHLRMKLEHVGINRLKTASNFIDKIASKSSFSGLSYRIKFGNGTEMTAQQFFRQKLRQIEQKQP